MLAAIVDAPGTLPRSGSSDLPPCAPGTTRVAMLAAPVNPLELLVASGNLHSARHESALVGRLAKVAPEVDVVFDGIDVISLEAAFQVCAPGPERQSWQLGGCCRPRSPRNLRGKQLIISGFAGLHTLLLRKQKLWAAPAGDELQLEVRTALPEDLADIWRAESALSHAKFVVVPTITKE